MQNEPSAGMTMFNKCRYFFRRFPNWRFFVARCGLFLAVPLFSGFALGSSNQCVSIFSTPRSLLEVMKSQLAAKDFDLFLLTPDEFLMTSGGQQFLENLKNVDQTLENFSRLKEPFKPVALRILSLLKSRGQPIPKALTIRASELGWREAQLRMSDISFAGQLSQVQQRHLTYLLILVGERRTKFQRSIQKVREAIGLESQDLVPLVQKSKTITTMGSEVRRMADEYNQRIKRGKLTSSAYADLVQGLFALYFKRQYQALSDSWFQIKGQEQSLRDFVNSDGYRQPVIHPNSHWMNVVTLPSEDVQNRQLKDFTRELWWNRDEGINPLGTVRISRNYFLDSEGQEQVASVEVLRKTEEGFFIPFLFEKDLDGQLRADQGPEAQKKLLSCFSCHLRLSGIFFGGINMPGYKAVDYWHINAIDLTRRKFYEKFEPFQAPRTDQGKTESVFQKWLQKKRKQLIGSHDL